MDDETVVKTMVVKERRVSDVKKVTRRLLVDDGADDALPKAQQDEVRRRCGLEVDDQKGS